MSAKRARQQKPAAAQTPAPAASGTSAIPLILLAFLAPGAWFVTSLPPMPFSKALVLGTAAMWLLAFGAGLVRYARPDRRVLLALVGVVASVTVSWLVAGSWLQVLFYDLFGNMPILLWLTFPLVFVLAAGARWRLNHVWRALAGVTIAAATLSAVMAYQQVMMNGSTVFGTTAYSVPALVAVIPVGIGVALWQTGWKRFVWFAAVAVIAGSLAVVSKSTIGTIATVFALLLAVAAQAALWRAPNRALRVGARAGLGVAALMLLGVLALQIPALGGGVTTPARMAAFDKNVQSRVQLWQGAQDMFMARPVFGYGPSGYRTAAVEYLAPEALQYGPDAAGNADPTVYSPQSPHALLWEILTRLGVVGLMAFLALVVTWGMALTKALRSDDREFALRASLGAALGASLFALMANPIVFPIGLFGAVAGGLAIAPLATGSRDADRAASVTWMKPVGLTAGAILLAVSVWLGAAEWQAYTAPTDDAATSVTRYEAALRLAPGHPLIQRRLLENRLLLAENNALAASAQQAVDAASALQQEFAPNLVNFVAYSLTQAERTGRSDLAWEQRMLDDASSRLPLIPSLAGERLHLALVAGDRAAVAAAVEDARTWGAPYPYTAAYLERADKLLATP